MNDELAAVLKQQAAGLQQQTLEFFSDDFYGDFYDFFVNFLKFKQLTSQIEAAKWQKINLILYLDLFQDPHNDLQTYSYKLTFDHELNFIEQQSCFTLSGLMKELQAAPDDLSDYQNAQKQILHQLKTDFAYQNKHEQIAKFNQVLGQIFQKYNLNKNTIAYQINY